jgi:hypothetical protein
MSVRTSVGDQHFRQRLRRLRRPAWLGTMRRTRPLSYHWGRERGTPVDRYYIERFLEAHKADIRGRVLEVMDSGYTTRFGTDVLQADVLDIDSSNSRATIVGDLARRETLPSEAFDCVVLTQTLQFIYEVEAAIAGARQTLRDGGVLLATVPGVSKIDPNGRGGDFWRFTADSAAKAFASAFGSEHVAVKASGNVLTAVAFLMGMAAEELKLRELEHLDDQFPVLVGVRAIKTS